MGGGFAGNRSKTRSCIDFRYHRAASAAAFSRCLIQQSLSAQGIFLVNKMLTLIDFLDVRFVIDFVLFVSVPFVMLLVVVVNRRLAKGLSAST